MDLNLGGAFVAEVLLTFLLVYVCAVGHPQGAVIGFDGLAIGLALAAVHLIGIPLTAPRCNPARSIGPALFAGGAASPSCGCSSSRR